MLHPAMQTIAKRWGIQDCIVARESREMMERAQFMSDDKSRGHTAKILAKAAVKGGAKATAKLSGKLLGVFNNWAQTYGKEYLDRVKETVSKANILSASCDRIEKKLNTFTELPKHHVYTGGWTSKICFEDEVDLEACLRFSAAENSAEGVVKQYTVKTRTILGKSRKLEDDTLSRLGRSSSRAVKRASGILGIVNPNGSVEAIPLAGNVIVVIRNQGKEYEKVEFAVSKGGSYGERIEQLTLEQCHESIKAVRAIINNLKAHGAGRKVFGYKGINDEIEHMRSSLKEMSGPELRYATLRFKNAVALENAYVTAEVRVAEGLLDWIKSTMISKE
ncbi:MAG: hypothetical protein ACRDBQ_18795 [Shewanella sp.]